VEFTYHRLARSAPGYRWWKPLVTGLIALGICFGFLIVLVVLLLASTLVLPELRPLITKLAAGTIDNSLPVVLALSLSSVAVLLPSVWLARLIMGPRPVGLLSSIAGRLRWRWMARLIPAVVIAYGASTLFSILLLPLLTGESIPPAVVSSSTWTVVLVAVLLVPLQATAEEFFFRGYLAQTIGGWLKHPLFAILLPVPLFTISHPQYDVWGLIDVSVFAVVAGWLVWRTGGLEASIVAHVVNNTVIFVIGAFGLVDVNSKTGGPIEYGWLVLRAAKRFGLERVRVIALPPPPDPETIVLSEGGTECAVPPRG
jgi:membrane protease YdiL (CAAX protease family)